MKGISWVSCGVTHAMVGTKKGKILAWGNTKGFTDDKNPLSAHQQIPVDITEAVERYIPASSIHHISSGNKFTVIATEKG